MSLTFLVWKLLVSEEVSEDKNFMHFDSGFLRGRSSLMNLID